MPAARHRATWLTLWPAAATLVVPTAERAAPGLEPCAALLQTDAARRFYLVG